MTANEPQHVLFSKKGQVIYLWPYLEWGGAQIYFAGIMKLAKLRYEILAAMPLSSDRKLIGYMERIGIDCEFFPAHLDTSQARFLWAKIRRRIKNAYCSFVIFKYLSRKPLKRIILHLDIAPWSSFLLLSYLSMRTNVNVTLHIAMPRASFLRRSEWQFKFRILSLFPHFSLLASNRDMLESLRRYLPSDYLSSVPIAYTGVDINEIKRVLNAHLDRHYLCRRYGLPSHRFLIFSLGQLILRKGSLVLLEAVKELRVFPDCPFFVWIGEGALRKDVERLIDRDSMHDYFKIIRPANIGPDRFEVLALVSLADLFVLPSFSEGLPGALLEAMALGKPCIASRINAIPEAVKDHETGLLVPAGDSVALAAAIRLLMSDNVLRERLAQSGQAYVNEHFDERIAAQITMHHYEAYRRRQ